MAINIKIKSYFRFHVINKHSVLVNGHIKVVFGEERQKK